MSDGRLSVPVRVLRSTAWWTGESREVVAELTRPGVVRLFDADFAQERLSDVLRDWPGADGLEFKLVMADRYRRLKLYSDGRLTLTQEVLSTLREEPGQLSQLFAEGSSTAVELMTLRIRNERLADHTRFPIIPYEE
jgi:hypothetical protein